MRDSHSEKETKAFVKILLKLKIEILAITPWLTS